tara:strand:+ start:3033 stop:3173 length:141 start_codon:yes stop_codon:yes gene_type:complete
MDKEDKEDKELEKEIKQELKVYKERRHKIRVQEALDKHTKNIMGSF